MNSKVCSNSPDLPTPVGHYTHVCAAGNLLMISGQLPVSREGRPLTDAPFETQALQVFANLDACLAQGGTDKSRLVQVRVYVTDMQHWPLFDRLYAQWLGDHRPARAVAGVAQLHYGLAVEVEAMALRPE
ncbi:MULTISPECIES: RidA family protein [unclassified Pseudomonas]|uniref:RidA family protein n=1 Tax=unclassified Pseudomonas TaxID=196821 RepID=UPI00384B0553